jgi:hypothetical protein
MSGQDIDGDFTACDAAVLNRSFADYLASHGQGGTNTRQQNPVAPVHLAGGDLRPSSSMDVGAAAVCAGEEEAVDAGAGVHLRPARGNRQRTVAVF